MTVRTSLRRFSALFALSALVVVSAGFAPVPSPLASEDSMQDSGQDPTVFVVVTSPDNMTQGMALVLAGQSLQQGAQVRVLLCGPGATVALAGHDGASLQPRNVSPGQLLDGLIAGGVQVDVCAIFLPNTGWSEADLRDGVGVAQPPEVAGFMIQPGVRYFTFRG
jgi:predicted peroxiredoxin